MAERWKEADDDAIRRLHAWTPTEKAERDQIIGALAAALTLPTPQVNYQQIAHALGGSDSEELIEKMVRYGIPCPILSRELTAPERERLVQINEAYAEKRDGCALAVVAFVREVWCRP